MVSANNLNLCLLLCHHGTIEVDGKKIKLICGEALSKEESSNVLSGGDGLLRTHPTKVAVQA